MGLFRKKKNKVYVTLNAAEKRLAVQAMMRFRSKCLATGKPTEDINELLLRLLK